MTLSMGTWVKSQSLLIVSKQALIFDRGCDPNVAGFGHAAVGQVYR